MKILYIFHEFFDRHEKYGHIINGLGHDVTFKRITRKTIPNQVNLNDVSGGYDLIWLISPFLISEKVINDEALNYIKTKKIPIAVYSTLHTNKKIEDMVPVWTKIDFCFVQNKLLNKKLKEGGANSFFIPIGFNLDQYYPVKRFKRYDLSFSGSPQTMVPIEEDRRVQHILALQKYYKVKVFGLTFNERGIRAGRCTTHRKFRSIYAKTKINLDLPYVNSPGDVHGFMLHQKNRFFEIAASRAFLLTARFEEYLEILDESMVGYYGPDNVESLIAEAANICIIKNYGKKWLTGHIVKLPVAALTMSPDSKRCLKLLIRKFINKYF